MQPKSIILFFYGYILFFRRQNLLDKLEKLNSLISQNWHETIHKRLKNTYDISYMDSL